MTVIVVMVKVRSDFMLFFPLKRMWLEIPKKTVFVK